MKELGKESCIIIIFIIVIGSRYIPNCFQYFKPNQIIFQEKKSQICSFINQI